MAASKQPSAINRSSVTRDSVPSFSGAGHTALAPRTVSASVKPAIFNSSANTKAVGVQLLTPANNAEVAPGDLIEWGIQVRKNNAANTDTSVKFDAWIEESTDGGATWRQIYPEDNATPGTNPMAFLINVGIDVADTDFYPQNVASPSTSISDYFLIEFIVPKRNPSGTNKPQYRLRVKAYDTDNAANNTGGTNVVLASRTARLAAVKFGANRATPYSPTLDAAVQAKTQNAFISTFPYYQRDSGAGATEGSMYKHFKAATRYLNGSKYGYEVVLDTAPTDSLGYVERGGLRPHPVTATGVGPGDGGFEGGKITSDDGDLNSSWDTDGFSVGKIVSGSSRTGSLSANIGIFIAGGDVGGLFQSTAESQKAKWRASRWYNVRLYKKTATGSTGTVQVKFKGGGTVASINAATDAGDGYVERGVMVKTPASDFRLHLEGQSDAAVSTSMDIDDLTLVNPGVDLIAATTVSAADASVETQFTLTPPAGGGTDHFTAVAQNLTFDGDVIARKEQADIGLRLVSGSGASGLAAKAGGYKLHANDAAAADTALTNADVDLLLESIETRGYREDNTANPTDLADLTQANGGTQVTEGGHAFNKGRPIQVKAKPFNDKQKDGLTDATISPAAGTVTSTAISASPVSAPWNSTERKWITGTAVVLTTGAGEASTCSASGTINGQASEATGGLTSCDDAKWDVVATLYAQKDGAAQTTGTFPPDGDVETRLTSGAGALTERFHRGEVVNLATHLYNCRGQLLKSFGASELTLLAVDVTGGGTVAAGTVGTDAAGKLTSTYTIPSTDPAVFNSDFADTIGTDGTHSRHKKLRATDTKGNTVDSMAEWGAARRGQWSESSASVLAGIFTGKTAAPTSDQTTVRNRGQTLFLRGFLFNCRGQLMGAQALTWNTRPTGAETYDEPDQSHTTASGEFGSSGTPASYVVDTNEATGGKTLVGAWNGASGVACDAASNQPRAGTGGTGNFAETSTGSPEWTVSSTYTAECRTQKENTRNADTEDTQFTIGEDVIYAYAQILDASGDAVNGARVDFLQLEPGPGAIRQQDHVNIATGSDGWTVAQGHDTRAPQGANWVMRADSGTTLANTYAANNGNTFTNDQLVSMLSAFTANKNIAILLGPVAGVPSSVAGYPTPGASHHPKPGDRIILGIGFIVSGVRTVPDSTPTPQFQLISFNQSTSKAEVLQADFTWKDKDAVGYTEHFFDFKQSIEGGLEWIAQFGTTAQGVTGTVGYVTDTASWPTRLLLVNIRLHYNSQEFRDDAFFNFISAASQHPYASVILPEANVAFSDTGHDHTAGGTKGAAIGDRG